ncbi:MAG: pyridoxamine 5'-phosphate oxidase family protein [Rhodobacter sp.]|nr:pyridoxamine 5'-phosphate oxidase family protein [Rhodobacter sp.]
MTDWSKSLEDFHARLWLDLSNAVTPPARRIVLSTIGRSGGPEARMAVLRAADRGRAEAAIHTDSHSTKIAELHADPRATLHSWNDTLQLQLRLRGVMRIATGDDAAHLWPQVPDGSRSSYGVTPAPGTAIASSDAYSRAPDPGRFAVLTLRIEEIDAVHLSGDYHRRAVFCRRNGWAGAWLAP